ncbi:phosphoadenosine phosphosulfate reductase family protein [Streptomyces cellulosae]|uniref:Phosphoadenosine phosphosulfate reductase family protein n=1 Tax=Streptomyces cellulosae TaxID=1968 RepID=A0ABW6JK35_STRCE
MSTPTPTPTTATPRRPARKSSTLARKQGLADSATWLAARRTARQTWPDHALDMLIDRTVTQIRATCAGKRAGYAWSGGKDSIALDWLCRQAGIDECVLGISNLEFPAFLTWVTDNMPPGLTVINTGLSLAWLRERPHMLFPQGVNGSKWFPLINHKAQEQFFKQQRLDVLLLGRRHADGNYTGPKGSVLYTNAKGITRYSPIAHWSHEAVFALIERENLPMPPCYDWPRGYQVGTGAWPARQWTHNVDHGFEEVWQIDPDVVRHAATELPQAADWLARTGRN